MQQNLLKKIYEVARDLVFPSTCISCGIDHEVLCDTCLFSIPMDTYSEKNMHAVFSYNEPVIRRSLHSLKYKNNTALAKRLAIPLHDKILQELIHQEKFNGFTKPLIIPIPLHKKRKRQRGYNQTEILCNELSLIDNSFYRTENHVLYKHKHTPSQTEILNRKKRLKNIQNCFSAKNPEKIQGRNIILIDDITTTGATFNEASRVLKKAGAKRVICFAVAH